MAARIRATIRSQVAHLRRLAVVFAVELRLKIVVELYMRPMSPKQFYEAYGGGSLSRVSRNFDRLAEHRWLRHVGSKGPGGDRRGAVEHFYRATELAFFDQETWAVLPYSIRVAFSWNIYSQIAAPLSKAIEEDMLRARAGSSLLGKTLYVDELGWGRSIAAVTDVFELVYQEQDDARERTSRTGKSLLRANIVQFAFESPPHGSKRSRSSLLVAAEEPMIPLLLRTSRVMADELCMKIIEVAGRRTISAVEFHDEFGGNLGKIRRRFRKATENGWLEEVDWKTGGRRRGATEKYYRATRPATAKADQLLTGASGSVRQIADWKTFEGIHHAFVRAMNEETVDARTDRCLAWSLVQLDQEGWEKVTRALQKLWETLLEEQEAAKARMKGSDEQLIPMTVALSAFETLSDTTKEP